jgi:hypothetical protein
MHVCGDHATQRELDQIAAYQFRGRYSFPNAIALDRGVEGEPRFQCRQGGLGAPLLEVGKRSIEYQQGRNDRSLVILMQHKLEHN